MSNPTFRQLSRQERVPTDPLQAADINCGSFQRIADACELVARNHQQLVNDRDFYKRRFEEELAQRKKVELSAAAIRGAATKLRQRVAELESQNRQQAEELAALKGGAR